VVRAVDVVVLVAVVVRAVAVVAAATTVVVVQTVNRVNSSRKFSNLLVLPV
jgi:hypothetical protein